MGADEAGERGPARGSRRDSLFLLTILSAPDGRNLGSARVRNLSATGLMADCEKPFSQGDRVTMKLRGVGSVEGTIAWAKSDRIGVSFDAPIDPQLARRPVSDTASSAILPEYLRVPVAAPRGRR
ncbi:pilus assembly protein PilZ [Sphingobium sp. SCG-1]|uniref:PilZ domain-containing protein n=1 Tax=Sphingobium sp. SCG-1 TaxID=2072936 RepID=UPI000CD6BB41|nr:PilZ domain-containing protein [Sphingobium sp. SCG-1]AUW60208.1 pilus assembly protein PilZ [Sphingobium sp. SCG-1]